MRSVRDVLAGLPRVYHDRLPTPTYSPRENTGDGARVGFCVPSMRNHMTDEGWQLFKALEKAGYDLAGFAYPSAATDPTDVSQVLDAYGPCTVVLQDKREWIGRTAGPGFDRRETFVNVGILPHFPHIFRVGVLKDAHSDHPLHIDSAREAGFHAWIVYYHPDIVVAQAPFVRREHLVRTYHSVDPRSIAELVWGNRGAGVLSGARSSVYPLRSRLHLACMNTQMRQLAVIPHPGYGRDRCHTPNYIDCLSRYRVAVCTSSRYGYALRKIIEATAAGCVVVTDLPTDEVLPEIDGNLVRVADDINPRELDDMIGDHAARWDTERQREYSRRAVQYYGYPAVGRRLADDIETLRREYSRTGAGL